MKSSIESTKKKIKNNSVTICMVALIALAAYGYELFNINLTIDEELAALRTEINPGFISVLRAASSSSMVIWILKSS